MEMENGYEDPRTKEAQRKYRKSERNKLVQRRYSASPKGQLRRSRALFQARLSEWTLFHPNGTIEEFCQDLGIPLEKK